MEQRLEIPFSTIFKILISLLFFWLIFFLRDILVLIFLSVSIAILFSSIIDFLEEKKIPRLLATIIVFLLFFLFLAILGYFLFPLILKETNQFLKFWPQYFEKATFYIKKINLDKELSLDQIFSYFENLSKNIFKFLFAIFGGLLNTLFVFSLAFFLSLEKRGVENAILFFFKENERERVLTIWKNVEDKILNWFKIRIINCFFIFFLCLISFLFLNANYPVLLAILAGILDFIPILGPFFTILIIVLFNIFDSIAKTFFLILAFLLAQQIGNLVLTPYLSKKEFNFSFALTLIFLAIGGKIGGIFGAIFAIPFFAILVEFLKEYKQ